MSTNRAYIYELYGKLDNDNQPIIVALDIENIVLTTYIVHTIESVVH